ncbi:MAG: FeoB-associated Cys-rich membrane protein [Thermodesulfobacteriota bacterium]
MWQEIVVGLIVVAAAILIGRRFWKMFAGKNGSQVSCSCGCTHCEGAGGGTTNCRETSVNEVR